MVILILILKKPQSFCMLIITIYLVASMHDQAKPVVALIYFISAKSAGFHPVTKFCWGGGDGGWGA